MTLSQSPPYETTPIEDIKGKLDVIAKFTKRWALPLDPSSDMRSSSDWLPSAMALQDELVELRHKEHIRRMLIDGRSYLRTLGCLMDEVDGVAFLEKGSLKAVWRETYALACRIQWCMHQLVVEAERLGVEV